MSKDEISGKRDEGVRVRLTADEHAMLKQRAHAQGCSMSEHVRRCAVFGERPASPNVDRGLVRRMLLRLQRLVGDVDQMARQLDAFGAPERDRERASAALDAVVKMRGEFAGLASEIRKGKEGRQ